MKEVAWQHIIDHNIPLPASQLRLYNDNGDFTGYRVFHSDDATDPEPKETTTATPMGIDEQLNEEIHSDNDVENDTHDQTIAVEIDDVQEHTREHHLPVKQHFR